MMQVRAGESESQLKALGGVSFPRRFAWIFGGLALVFVSLILGMGSEWREALDRIAGVEKVKSQDFVIAHARWGLYWGCVFNAILSAGLALTARWWAAGHESRQVPGVRLPWVRQQWLWLLLILAGAGALRWARLDLSLYNDEAHNFRRYFVGYFQNRADGTQRWRAPSWGETLWLNKVGNNSTPFSAAARFSNETAQRFSRAEEGRVNETALRFPAWLAGMGSLVVIWAFGRRLLPGTSASWWMLGLASLHPWHVRYSSEARGYAFMILGVSLCLYFAQRAWTENRWRWWLGMGAAQFLAIWSFSGTLYYFFVFNGLFLVGWGWRTWRRREGWRNLAGPLLGMMVGAMLTVPVMLPMVPQLLDALAANDSIHGHMGAMWWRGVAGGFGAGIRWVDGDPTNPLNLSASRFLTLQPALWAVVVVVAIWAAIGMAVLFRVGGFARIVVLAGPLAVVLGWFSLSRSGNFMHLWYLLHSLPGWLAVLAAPVALLKPGGSLWKRLSVAAGLVLILGAWLMLDLKLTRLGKEDLRGVAEAVPAGALHAAAYSDVDIYDRHVVILDAPAELENVIARARTENRPLYFSFSRKIADPAFEALFERIETSGEFRKVASLWGQDEGQFTHVLYQLN